MLGRHGFAGLGAEPFDPNKLVTALVGGVVSLEQAKIGAESAEALAEQKRLLEEARLTAGATGGAPVQSTSDLMMKGVMIGVPILAAGMILLLILKKKKK